VVGIIGCWRRIGESIHALGKLDVGMLSAV